MNENAKAWLEACKELKELNKIKSDLRTRDTFYTLFTLNRVHGVPYCAAVLYTDKHKTEEAYAVAFYLLYKSGLKQEVSVHYVDAPIKYRSIMGYVRCETLILLGCNYTSEEIEEVRKRYTGKVKVGAYARNLEISRKYNLPLIGKLIDNYELTCNPDIYTGKEVVEA